MPALAREAADRMGAVLLGGLDDKRTPTDAGDRGRIATSCYQNCYQSQTRMILLQVLSL